jgi:hypothetical protein
MVNIQLPTADQLSVAVDSWVTGAQVDLSDTSTTSNLW